MTPADHAQVAQTLLQAEETGQQIGLISKAYPQITMDDAYACLLYTSDAADE